MLSGLWELLPKGCRSDWSSHMREATSLGLWLSWELNSWKLQVCNTYRPYRQYIWVESEDVLSNMDIRYLSVLRGESGQRQNCVSRRDGLMVSLWHRNGQHWKGVIKGVSSTDKLNQCCYFSQLSVKERAGACHWKKHIIFKGITLSQLFWGLHLNLRWP